VREWQSTTCVITGLPQQLGRPCRKSILPGNIGSIVLLLTPHSYAVSFDEALKEATSAKPEERQAKMSALLKRSDAKKAHPTLEHLLPIYVAAGAAGSDVGEQLWTLPERSASWAQYRFGKVAAA
jgi:hypothetical protein